MFINKKFVMLPYYILLFVVFFVEGVEYVLSLNKKNTFIVKSSNHSITLFFFLWFIFLSCRSLSCGIDLHNYNYFFEQVTNVDLGKFLEYYKTEQLYFLLNWAVAQIYPEFRLILIIVAFLCTKLVGDFYRRESEHALLSILLFVTNVCFVMFYSGLRQSLAMLFIIPAYYMTKNKQLIPFLLIVFLAKLFHNSAIIMLLLYPIFHIPLRSKHFIFVMMTVALFFIFKAQIFTVAVPLLGGKYARGALSETGAYSVWIMFLLYLLYSFLVLDDSKMNKECLGLRNILVIMTLIQGFAPVNPLAMRMNYYFIMLFPVVVPKLMKYPKAGNENFVQMSKWGMILFFTVYFIIHINSGYQGLGAFPYVAFWE